MATLPTAMAVITLTGPSQPCSSLSVLIANGHVGTLNCWDGDGADDCRAMALWILRLIGLGRLPHRWAAGRTPSLVCILDDGQYPYLEGRAGRRNGLLVDLAPPPTPLVVSTPARRLLRSAE